MDDDEDTQSHSSLKPETEPEPEPEPIDLYAMHKREQSSGGVTVTVAAAPPSGSAAASPITPPAPLTLALPIQQYSTSSSNARPITTLIMNGAGGVIGGGREDCWSEGATSVLIDAWGERYLELSRGNLKQKHWMEVADIVNCSGEDHAKVPKTDIQCKNRIDTVKKKYKMEKSKVVSGVGPSRWVFFERMDRLIGPSAAVNSAVKVAVSPVNGQDAAVPVGIPFGVPQQPIPLAMQPPMYQTPPHYRPPSQQHSVTRNFPTPTPLQQRFSHPSMNNSNSNHGYGGNMGNSSGRNQVMHQQQQQYQQQQQQQLRRAPSPVESDEDEDEMSNESGDSLPPARPTEYERRERVRNVSGGVRKGKKGKKRVKVWGNSVRVLTRAILKFGEAYETAESAKLEHIVEMEKQRMKFAKDLELQRMKFLMKTQLELSQFNGESGGNGGSGDSAGSSGRSGGSGGVAGGLESNNLH